jgi:hypothetical protein
MHVKIKVKDVKFNWLKTRAKPWQNIFKLSLEKLTITHRQDHTVKICKDISHELDIKYTLNLPNLGASKVCCKVSH